MDTVFVVPEVAVGRGHVAAIATPSLSASAFPDPAGLRPGRRHVVDLDH